MSIANNSVLRRILTEVVEDPVEVGSEPVARDASGADRLELCRTPAPRRPPFATPLHFWAHALFAFLQRGGRTDLFEALAANCLCEAVEAPRVAPFLESACALVEPAVELPDRDSWTGAYRMIDERPLASAVAESRDAYLALFWTESDWLARATLLDLDAFSDPQ